jgi:glycosyltransferase involved in cell wall biosynthesis
MNEHINVLILTCEHEHFIEECLNSVIGQVVDIPIEIIVMDDASKDNTSSLVKKVTQKNKIPIKLITNKKRLGCYLNLRKGIQHCTGKYVAYLEGDDFFCNSRKLQIQLDFMEHNKEFSCHGAGVQFVDEQSRLLINKYYNLSCDRVLTNAEIWGYPIFQTSTLFFRRDLITNLPKMFKNTISNDRILFALLFDKGPVFYNHLVLTAYRFHSKNLSLTTSYPKKLINFIKVDILLLIHLGLKNRNIVVRNFFKYFRSYVLYFIEKFRIHAKNR